MTEPEQTTDPAAVPAGEPVVIQPADEVPSADQGQPGTVAEPVPVAEQRAAGVDPEATVTMADQRQGVPPPPEVLPDAPGTAFPVGEQPDAPETPPLTGQPPGVAAETALPMTPDEIAAEEEANRADAERMAEEAGVEQVTPVATAEPSPVAHPDSGQYGPPDREMGGAVEVTEAAQDQGAPDVTTTIREGGGTANESPQLPATLPAGAARAHALLEQALAVGNGDTALDGGEVQADAMPPAPEDLLARVMAILDRARAELDRYVPAVLRHAATVEAQSVISNELK